VIVEALLLLTLQGEPVISIRPWNRPGTQKKLDRLGTSSRAALVVEFRKPVLNQALDRALAAVVENATQLEAFLPINRVAAGLVSRPRGNLSALGSALVGEDIKWIFDGAWVIATGERVEAFIAGDWPVASLATRLFARLASLTPSPHRQASSKKLPAQPMSVKESQRPLPHQDLVGHPGTTVARITSEQRGIDLDDPQLQIIPRSPAEQAVTHKRSTKLAPLPSSSSSILDVTQFLDTLEAQLDAVGDTELVDELFAVLSREQVAEPAQPFMRSVLWLHQQHFEATGKSRPGKDVQKFTRRLRLLLDSARNPDNRFASAGSV